MKPPHAIGRPSRPWVPPSGGSHIECIRVGQVFRGCWVRWVWLVLLGACFGGASGCEALNGSSQRYALRSYERGSVVEPDLAARVYTHEDRNTADIYLTDIPIERLRSGVAAGDLVGHIIHVHMFVHPRAGRTPIEPTAFTAAVTHAVVASGEVGVYRGGGFLSPRGAPGAGRFGGVISAGTLRLESATSDFADRLGVSELKAEFSAASNDPLARLLRVRLNELVTMARPVETGGGAASGVDGDAAGAEAGGS